LYYLTKAESFVFYAYMERLKLWRNNNHFISQSFFVF